MQLAGRRTDFLGDGGREGDHVVLGDRLDLLDPGDVELRLARISPAASAGMRPASAIASAAASSTSSHVS